MRHFIICTAHLHVIRVIKSSQVKQNAMDGPHHMCSSSHKKLLAPYGTQGSWFITAVTRAPHPCPSSEPHQSSPQFTIQCNIIFQSVTRSTKWSLSFSCPHQTHYASFLLPNHATCPTHLFLLDFITQKTSDDKYKPRSSALCNFLQSPVTPHAQIYSSANYSQTPSAHNHPFMSISAVYNYRRQLQPVLWHNPTCSWRD